MCDLTDVKINITRNDFAVCPAAAAAAIGFDFGVERESGPAVDTHGAKATELNELKRGNQCSHVISTRGICLSTITLYDFSFAASAVVTILNFLSIKRIQYVRYGFVYTSLFVFRRF